ncbi:MAG: hypothetical protein ACE5FM_02910, partial [Methyloligellaceae bacterium]
QSLQPGYDLIITNGDAAGEILRKAFTGTEVLPWRDVLHEGPVPLTKDHEELSGIRAEFLSKRGWGEAAVLRENFTARDRGLAHHETFKTVTLWFEHDLYDQLQLIQILGWFAASPRENGTLLLVQAHDFLGTQTPEDLAGFAENAKPVSTTQLAVASTAWGAFRQPTPESWAALLNQDISALPCLEPAVRRMLQEMPAYLSGLSRTQHQILMAINEGVNEPHKLFCAVERLEEAAFMGDWSFWSWLDGLACGPARLIEGLEARFTPAMSLDDFKAYAASSLRLSALGLQILAGGADYADAARIDRWIGGTHLTSDHLWRWDDQKGELMAPV